METNIQQKAFVGHSFTDRDKSIIDKIIRFIEKYDFVCKTGEKAQNKSVSQKVKDRIDECDFFVGIFTKSEELCATNTKKGLLAFLCRGKAIPSGSFMTSNWVLQESGYALGKNKPVLLMVERGIHNFPELQGDQEIVPFKRTDIDSALLRLSDILHDMKLKYYQPKLNQVAILPTSEVESAKQEGQERKDSDTVPFKEFSAALKNKNIERMESVYKEKIRNTLDESKKEFWDAMVLKFKYLLGNSDALTKLKDTVKKTKDANVVNQLAQCYEFGEKQKEAMEAYQQSILLSDTNSGKVFYIIKIATCLEKLDGAARAVEYLLSEIRNNRAYGNVEDIFRSLLSYTKKLNDEYLFLVFCEQLLSINPVNAKIRFDLAFKYSEINQNNLAIYHYRKYLNITDDPIALNNVAVSYDSLGLKVKAVESYKKSKEKEMTLAMSNLADKYLNEGFVEEAQLLLKSAEELSMKGVDVHQNIGLAKKRIEEILEDEEKRESELLSETDKIHRFRVKHANSYCLPPDTPLTSRCIRSCSVDKWGSVPMALDFDGGRIEGTSRIRLENTDSLFSALLASKGLDGVKRYKVREITILGDFRNLAGKYSLKVTETAESEGTQPEEVFSANGLFVMNMDLSNLELLQVVNDKQSFSNWPLRNPDGN